MKVVWDAHDATTCTVDGSTVWIGSVSRVEPFKRKPVVLDVEEFDTAEQASAWARNRARFLAGQKCEREVAAP